MKKFLPIIFIAAFNLAFAQTKRVNFFDSIINQTVLKIPTYGLSTNSQLSKFFKMPFGKSEFTDTIGIYELQNAEILSVDLVFTDYPSNLDLKVLNKNRFISLSKLLPNALSNKYTIWQVYRQMDGKDKETAKGMLHGFVINYRNKSTPETIKKEIDLIKSITPIEEDITPIAPAKKEKIRHWSVIHDANRNAQKLLFGRKLKAYSTSKSKAIQTFVYGDTLLTITPQMAYDLKIITGKENNINPKQDSIYVLLDIIPTEDVGVLKKVTKPVVNVKLDSTINNVFARNKFSNLLIIADVTGSMSPYNAQVIDWLSNEANTSNLKALVCFNDGDTRWNNQKPLGSTGGIYGETFVNVSQISDLMQNVMSKGSGGDYPENVCEAIIKSTEMFYDYENIVLIADSWAPVRDIALLPKILKPVRIITCGDFAPHADYIGIAFFTKGSLHLKDMDINNFSALNNGGTITIKGKNYKLQDGRVVVF